MPVGLFFLFLFFSQTAYSIIGGELVDRSELRKKIFKLDTQLEQESIVCTATAISYNKLLTAAHCFSHLLSKGCFSQHNDDCKMKMTLNDKPINPLLVKIHPKFKQSHNFKRYSQRTNFDLAIVKFKGKKFKHYFKVNNKKQNGKKRGEFFGFGMSHLTPYNEDGESLFLEQKRGDLKKVDILKRNVINGLFSLDQSKLYVKENEVILSQGGQILRSDSGGPVIVQNEVVGVARNYSFIHRQMGGKTEAFLQSFFTSLEGISLDF